MKKVSETTNDDFGIHSTTRSSSGCWWGRGGGITRTAISGRESVDRVRKHDGTSCDTPSCALPTEKNVSMNTPNLVLGAKPDACCDRGAPIFC